MFDPDRDHIRIVLSDLEASILIGLHPWEQEKPQRILVNAEVWAYAGAVYTDDHATRIVDYDRIRNRVRDEWPKRPHIKLLEPLAEELIALCFTFPDVEAARVRVEKPDIFPDAKSVGIELYRRRPKRL